MFLYESEFLLSNHRLVGDASVSEAQSKLPTHIVANSFLDAVKAGEKLAGKYFVLFGLKLVSSNVNVHQVGE